MGPARVAIPLLVAAALAGCARRGGGDDPYAGGRWIPGDLHAHVTPLDREGDVALDVEGIARLAREEGLEFVFLTPHLRPPTWDDPVQRRRFLAGHAEMAAAARAVERPTLVPGVEVTVPDVGHFGVSGVAPGALAGADGFLEAAAGAGALVVVNHPWAVPTRIPGIRASHADVSYRPWTAGAEGFDRFHAVEVWNVRLGLGNLVSRPGGRTAEDFALERAARHVRETGRRVALVGGSDNHGRMLPATTWVFAGDASEAAILAGIRAGATCVGGPEAGTLRARGDRDPPGAWARIGGTARAAGTVELRFDGEARVFVDGDDRGVHRGRFVHDGVEGVHAYRIVAGRSRSGFVYANLD
jgi:hypothetical protein